MPFMEPLPLLLILLPSFIVSLPRPSPSSPPIYSDIDAHAVIEPFLRPFSHMYDMMQENHKAMSYAEKVSHTSFTAYFNMKLSPQTRLALFH